VRVTPRCFCLFLLLQSQRGREPDSKKKPMNISTQLRQENTHKKRQKQKGGPPVFAAAAALHRATTPMPAAAPAPHHPPPPSSPKPFLPAAEKSFPCMPTCTRRGPKGPARSLAEGGREKERAETQGDAGGGAVQEERGPPGDRAAGAPPRSICGHAMGVRDARERKLIGTGPPRDVTQT
jgi:hypothetical protein